MQAHLTNLESPLNFARFYMGELLGPGVCKVLYLDADVIVQGDAAELADLALPRGALCAATLRKNTLGVKGVQGLKGEKLQARFKVRLCVSRSYRRSIPRNGRAYERPLSSAARLVLRSARCLRSAASSGKTL